MNKINKYLPLFLIAIGIITSVSNLIFTISNGRVSEYPIKIISILLFISLYWIFNPKREISLAIFCVYITVFLFKIIYQQKYGMSIKLISEISIIILICIQFSYIIKFCYLPILKITNALFKKNDKYSKSMIKYAYLYCHNNEVIELGNCLLEHNDDDFIYYYIASANYRLNRFDTCISYYANVKSDSSFYSQALLFTAKSHIQLGHNRKAILEISKYLNDNPDDINALYLRADAYEELGMLKESIEDFKNVIKNHPEFSSAHYNIARLYNLVGNEKKCKETLLTAISCENPSADAFIALGNIEQEENNDTKAEEYFKAGIKIDPSLEKYIEKKNQ